jgi:hypothetical protein
MLQAGLRRVRTQAGIADDDQLSHRRDKRHDGLFHCGNETMMELTQPRIVAAMNMRHLTSGLSPCVRQYQLPCPGRA